MATLVEVDGKNFEEQVLKSDRPVMVDFAAEWCPPCKVLSPLVEEIAREYEGRAVVAHLDVDRAPDLARTYGVLSVPTVVFFKDGKVVSTSVGLVPKEKLTEALDEMIAQGGSG